MNNEIQQFDRLIPSYELALCAIAELMSHHYKSVLESTSIGPCEGGYTVAVNCETGTDTVGFTLQEAPYKSYQEALSAFGAMLDDITARYEGRASWKDEEWWDQHHEDLKARYGFELVSF